MMDAAQFCKKESSRIAPAEKTSRFSETQIRFLKFMVRHNVFPGPFKESFLILAEPGLLRKVFAQLFS
jgi:hypothetical protein